MAAFDLGLVPLSAAAWLVARPGWLRAALVPGAALALLAIPLPEPGRSLVGVAGMLPLLAWAGVEGLRLLAAGSGAAGRGGAQPGANP